MEFYSFLDSILYRKNKSVTFNKICKVALIPDRSEYINIKTILWYTDDDYDTFRNEYKSYITSNKILDD
jgi:hypothetical protein